MPVQGLGGSSEEMKVMDNGHATTVAWPVAPESSSNSQCQVRF